MKKTFTDSEDRDLRIQRLKAAVKQIIILHEQLGEVGKLTQDDYVNLYLPSLQKLETMISSAGIVISDWTQVSGALLQARLEAESQLSLDLPSNPA